MADQSVRWYLEALRDKGELWTTAKEIDPDSNMSAVAWRAYAERGQSSLFTNIKGHDGWRVMSQIVADRRKWAIALGVSESEFLATMIARMEKLRPPQPVERADAPCKAQIYIGDDVDLGRIPAMWTSERDPGRYIASGMCVVKDPNTGIQNVSYHRAQLIDRNRTGYLMLPRQAARIAALYRAQGRPMEVAMVIGTHPLLNFAGAFVAPFGVDEVTIAGALLDEPVRVVRCETSDLLVPADAEIVLEGTVDLADTNPEGPFGEVTGTYGQGGDIPVFTVRAMTHRDDPIFYAMSCGLPPSDTHSIVNTTIEMKLWQHLQAISGAADHLADIRCLGGVSPLLIVIQVKPGAPGFARNAMTAVLSSPYLHPKFVVAVDEDVDPASVDEVLWAIATRVDASTDIVRIGHTRVFGLDTPSEREPGVSGGTRVGTKMMIDATVSGETRGPYAKVRPPETDRVAAIVAEAVRAAR
jgi:2,5-furandicarboxylate decarboxylase 1